MLHYYGYCYQHSYLLLLTIVLILLITLLIFDYIDLKEIAFYFKLNHLYRLNIFFGILKNSFYQIARVKLHNLVQKTMEIVNMTNLHKKGWICQKIVDNCEYDIKEFKVIKQYITVKMSVMKIISYQRATLLNT